MPDADTEADEATDADPDPDPDTDEQDATEDETETSAEDAPEIADEEMAEAPVDALAEDVEDATAPETDADAEADADGDTDPDADPTDADAPLSKPEGESWGDLYVGTLTTVSNQLIEAKGREDAEQVDEDLARQLHLDEYMNDWMAAHGKREDMPPEQALLLSTGVFAVTVIASKTTLIEEMAEEIDL